MWCQSVVCPCHFKRLKKNIFTPIHRGWSSKRLITKRFHREKLRKDIRFSNFGSEMVKNCCVKKSYLMVFAPHCWWIRVKIRSSIIRSIVGELAEGGSMALTFGVSDMRQMTCDTWHVKTMFFYWYWYLHRSRDALSPLCIFFVLNQQLKFILNC